MSLMKILAGGVIAMTLCVPASAADQTSYGPLIGGIQIQNNLGSLNFGLRNMAAVKTVEARRLTVTGQAPTISIEAIAGCKNGSRLTAMQAFAGQVTNNNGQIWPMPTWGQSPKDSSVNGQVSAKRTLSFKLGVSRTYNHEAVDFSFNPARHFEKKLADFVNKGGSAAQYLQTSESFDMTVPIFVVAWCRGTSGNLLAGQERGGFVRRDLTASILFNGDPAIVDGRGVNASGRGTLAPPTTTDPLRKKD